MADEQNLIALTPDEWIDIQKGIGGILQQLALSKAIPRDAEPQASQHPVRYSPAFDVLGVYGKGLYSGIIERPRAVTNLTFDMLRKISYQTGIIPAIILTRQNQVAQFGQRPQTRLGPGFKVGLRAEQKQPTRAAQKLIDDIEELLLNMGYAKTGPYEKPRRGMRAVLAGLVRDSLTYDAACLEIVPGKNPHRYPVAVIEGVDGGAVRLTAPEVYRANLPALRSKSLPPVPTKPVHYIEYGPNGVVIAEYDKTELLYNIRNTSFAIVQLGYGISELELLVEVVSGLIFSLDYNIRYFTDASIPPGLVTLSGKFSPDTLEAFRNQWIAMFQGPRNRWAVPFVAGETAAAQYTPWRPPQKDMEYHQWIQFLITLACAVFGIHPEEVGFQAWSPLRPTLNQASPEANIIQSQDRGLRPLLRLIEGILDYIVTLIEPDFKCRLIGIDPVNEAQELQMAGQRLGMGLSTILEERQRFDMPVVKGEDGKPAKWQMLTGNPAVMQLQARELFAEAPGQPEPATPTPVPEEVTPEQSKGDEGQRKIPSHFLDMLREAEEREGGEEKSLAKGLTKFVVEVEP